MAVLNQVGNALTGSTGTGAFVGATSPTITTPIIGVIDDTNGAPLLQLSTAASAVNYIDIVNAATGGAVGISAVGSDAIIPLVISSKGGNATNILGTTLNSAAATGYVGEVLEIAPAPVALTSGVAANVASLSLTAGDWDVYGSFYLQPAAGGTTSAAQAGMSATSATLPTANYQTASGARLANEITAYPVPFARFLLSATTTVYLVCQATFAVAAMDGYGVIQARRAR